MMAIAAKAAGLGNNTGFWFIEQFLDDRSAPCEAMQPRCQAAEK